MEEVRQKHRADETDRSEYPYRGEFLHGIESGFAQGVVRHGIRDGDCRHEESHAEAVEYEQRGELYGVTRLHAVYSRTYHEETGKTMAEGEYLLGLDVTVGDYSHQRRHEDGHNSLHGEEPLDLGTQTDVAEITAEGSEVGAPYRELQEVHQDEL